MTIHLDIGLTSLAWAMGSVGCAWAVAWAFVGFFRALACCDDNNGDQE